MDATLSGEIHLVFNTAKGAGAIKDSFSLRQTALKNKIPYYTTVAGSRAAAEAIRSRHEFKCAASAGLSCRLLRLDVNLKVVVKICYVRSPVIG